MRGACSEVGWIRCANALRIRLAVALLALAPVTTGAQELPRVHVTALGMRADQRVVRPGQPFHVTVHAHLREKRERLDELVLPALTNAVDLGDERKRVPAPDGTDFYETLTVAANAPGTASFTPAYIDAIDPATGRALRYSSPPLTVRVAATANAPDGEPATGLVRGAVLGIVALGALAVVAFLASVRRPRPYPSAAPPTPAPADPLRGALAAYRAQGDDAALDVLRGVLFSRAGAAPGATFGDAVRALGSRDPQLARIMGIAERARFGPVPERAPAARDLLALLEAYLPAAEAGA